MLGIRKMNGVAIDLYQGDISTFYCDLLVVAEGVKLRCSGSEFAAKNRPAIPVLQVASPLWQGGGENEAQRLDDAYALSLTQIANLKVRHASIAGLGTESAGFPQAMAAARAMGAVKKFLDINEMADIKRITFVLVSSESYYAFQDALFETFPEVDL